jgi:hypothetical protein
MEWLRAVALIVLPQYWCNANSIGTLNWFATVSNHFDGWLAGYE